MNMEEYLLLGELKASVKDLQVGQDQLFRKSDEQTGKIDKLTGKIEEGWHTPIHCPNINVIAENRNAIKENRLALEDLRIFKARVLVFASTLGGILGALTKMLIDKILG